MLLYRLGYRLTGPAAHRVSATMAPSATSAMFTRFHSHSHSQPHSHSHSHEVDGDDDHVHLKQSETESNDQVIFGGKDKPFEYISGSPNDSKSTSIMNEATEPHFEPEPARNTLEHAHSHSLLSHSHSHTHADPLVASLSLKTLAKDPGSRITAIGLLTNVALASGKFVGGIVFHSQALLADAVHSISDLVSDFLTLFTISYSKRKPDTKFPNGYGKIESLGSLSVSSLLLVAGCSIGYSSLCSILGPMVPGAIVEAWQHFQHFIGESGAQSHTHAHSHVHAVTDINAAWIAGGSIFIKEWLYRATSAIAKKQNSSVLLANAWHHRVDSLTSLVAVATITSGIYLHIDWLDSVGGLLVSGLVIRAGYTGVKKSILDLCDRGIDAHDARYAEVVGDIESTLAKLISNNNSRTPYKVDKLELLASGPNLVASLQLQVPPQKWDNVLSITEFENVKRVLAQSLAKKRPELKKLSVEFVS